MKRNWGLEVLRHNESYELVSMPLKEVENYRRENGLEVVTPSEINAVINYFHNEVEKLSKGARFKSIRNKFKEIYGFFPNVDEGLKSKIIDVSKLASAEGKNVRIEVANNINNYLESLLALDIIIKAEG